MRCLGHGLKLGVVQFVKGRSVPGERKLLERFPDLVTITVMGEGFTWETPGPRARHRGRPRRARRGEADAPGPGAAPGRSWTSSTSSCATTRCRWTRCSRRWPPRRPGLHVVVTGRNAKPELIEAADLVTEMKLVKHPFRAGHQGPARDRVLARRGRADASGRGRPEMSSIGTPSGPGGSGGSPGSFRGIGSAGGAASSLTMAGLPGSFPGVMLGSFSALGSGPFRATPPATVVAVTSVLGLSSWLWPSSWR